MQKFAKILLSALVILSLLFNSTLCILAKTGTKGAQTEVLYEENFDGATIESLQAAGWKGLTQYDMLNGALRGKNNNAYYADTAAYNWDSYVYETKMTIATKNASNAVNGYFGIQFGVNSSGKGMEYGIHYTYNPATPATQSFTYRVYDRINAKFIINETSLQGKGLAMDQKMTLKVAVDGNTFTVYLNGTALATKTLDYTFGGTIGTLMSANTVYLLFDDLKVTKEAEEQADPDEPIPNSKTLLFDSFNQSNGDFIPEANTWTKAGSVEYLDGKLHCRSNASIYYVAPIAFNWKNYSFTTQMTITDKNISDSDWTATDGTVFSGMVIGAQPKTDSSGYTGYEFTVIYDGEKFTARLYDRTHGKLLCPATALTGLALNIPITLKAECYESKILCYVNDAEVFTYSVTDSSTLLGTVGLLGGSARTKFNYAHVVQEAALTPPAPTVDPDEPVPVTNTLFFDSFNAANGTFNPDADVWVKAGSVEYLDGKLHCRSNANLYHSAAQALDWKNYSVTTQMRITDQNTKGNAWTIADGTVFSGLVAGVNSEHKGYEFTVIYDGAKFTTRLYDRIHSTLLCPETELSGVALNRPAVLRMDVFEDMILCYINGEEVLSCVLPGTASLSGTVGLLGGSARTKFNYIHVVQLKPQSGSGTAEGDIVTLIEQDFDSNADGDKPIKLLAGWRQTNNDALVRGGRLHITKTANLYARNNFTDGYVSADIILERPSAALTAATAEKTVFPIWLTARNTQDMHEFRARFALTKKANGTYSAQVQIVVYSNTDYGRIPQVYSYPVQDFAFGNRYNLKLICLGNYFAVEFDGATLYEGACDNSHALFERSGAFGFSTLADTAEVGLDNVKIVKYLAKRVTVHPECVSTVSLYSYNDLTSNSAARYQRSAFYTGEHVVIQLLPAQGYVADPASVKYITASGEKQIVDHESATVYGFFMPPENAVVYAAFIKGGTAGGGIYFTDDFDGEDTMIDRGWSNNHRIHLGRLYLNPNENSPHVYLTGLSGSNKWTDYVLQAEVCVTDADPNSTGNVDVSSVSVRTSGYANGYEFGIQIPKQAQKGNFRLYNRKTGTMLAQSKGNTAERNKNYALKIMVEGNRMKCFVDGKLLFDVVDKQNSNPFGTIGLRSLGGGGSYDNVVVRQITAADRSDIPVVDVPKSPLTDAVSLRMQLLLALAILSFSGTCVCALYGTRRLKLRRFCPWQK